MSVPFARLAKTSKTAIVTAVESEFGEEIAKRLLDDGHHVVVGFRGGAGDATQAISRIVSSENSASFLCADLGDSSPVGALFDAAEDAFGPADILVNTSGLILRKELSAVSDEEFDSAVHTNLRAVFMTMREAARRLLPGGRIINVSMGYQGPPMPGFGVYFACKSALEELTRVAARELAPRGITVNALRPGPTRTRLMLEGGTPQAYKELQALMSSSRVGEPHDITEGVSYLVGDNGRWITGQVLDVCGGYW